MKMLHGTSRANVPLILRKGLLAACSKGRQKTVWLCSPGMIGFAITHASRRHGVKPENVVILVVDVPRGWLKKCGRKGVRHTGGRDVPQERFRSSLEFRRYGEP